MFINSPSPYNNSPSIANSALLGTQNSNYLETNLPVNRGLANSYIKENPFVRHLLNTAQKLGIREDQSAKILHDSNQGATTWLLKGSDALDIFVNSQVKPREDKGFFMNLLSAFSGAGKSQKNSILKDFYFKSQEAAKIDNLGEPWEHFKEALRRNRYSLMPVYDDASRDYLDPVAFAVFENFDMADRQKYSLFNSLAGGEASLSNLPEPVVFLDKYLTRESMDRGLDMESFEKNVIASFMNSQASRATTLVVPWKTNPVLGLKYKHVDGISHIGFSQRANKITVTERHVIDGQKHKALQATTLFNKPGRSYSLAQVKAIISAGTVNEITAGQVSRIKDSPAMFSKIKELAAENMANIDKTYQSSDNHSSAPANWMGFFSWIAKLFGSKAKLAG